VWGTLHGKRAETQTPHYEHLALILKQYWDSLKASAMGKGL